MVENADIVAMAGGTVAGVLLDCCKTTEDLRDEPDEPIGFMKR